MFDETFGRPLVGAMSQLCLFWREDVRLMHLLDFTQQEGAKDEQWVPRLAGSDWIVVSSDKGARGSSKLPRICWEHRITHVLFKGQMVHQQQFEKGRALLVVWNDLLLASTRPNGPRFRIRKGPSNPVLEYIGHPDDQSE